MAEENLDWLSTPKVLYQTVIAVKNFLDGEFAKYDKIKDLPNLLIDLLAGKNQQSLAEVRKSVGQTIILKFLGGNWQATTAFTHSRVPPDGVKPLTVILRRFLRRLEAERHNGLYTPKNVK